MNYLEIYKESIANIENISNRIDNDLGIDFDSLELEKSESTLDVADYCFTLLFGIMGALLSTNEKFEKYLADIHHAASGADGDYDVFQKLVGKLLYHKKDHIDIVGEQMMNRNGTPANIAFHRLLWGHDILSTGPDNPFHLMINQKGSKFLGIIQVFRHLLADTMSKQGLPMPGTSFLDFVNEDGKTTNYLIELSKNLSLETYGNKSMAQEIYSHMFTIRTQDIVGGALVKILTEVYFKIRKIDDKLRKAQMTFMAYAIDFFGEAIIGAIKHKGVPYINVPVGGAMLVSFAKFCYLDTKETMQLTNKTLELTKINEEIILKYDLHKDLLNPVNTVDEFIDDIDNIENNFDALIDFLGEDNQ